MTEVICGFNVTNTTTGEVRQCDAVRTPDGHWTFEGYAVTYAARLNNADGSRSTVYASSFDLARRKLLNRMARMGDRLPESVAEEVMALAEDINLEGAPFSHETCGMVFEVIAIEGETE
jgi:hypothetical protein